MKPAKKLSGKPPKYNFQLLQKEDSTLIFDEQGNIAMYSTELHKRVCRAVWSWRTNKNFPKRQKMQIAVRKSKEFGEDDMWYYAVRITRIK